MSQDETREAELLAVVDDACQTLEGLGEALARMSASLEGQAHPFGPALDEARWACERALEELAHPALTLATVGTTSSGKSTLLNALIGRRLAPMDTHEMSAGLLEIHHAKQWEMEVCSGQAALPATLDESSAHDAIRACMEGYHHARAQGTPPEIPHLRLSCPLFPMHPSHDFARALGGEVRFVAIDLPGLRTVDDQTHLEIIQSRVRRAFNLITLDYVTLFQREQRDLLLGELEQVVRELGGKLDTMLFIMNRVDLRTSQDSPLAESIAEAGRVITERLRPEQPVEVIPFSALLYFHASRLSTAFLQQDVALAQQIVQELRQDCGGLVEAHVFELDAATCARYLAALGEEVPERADVEALQDALEVQWGKIGNAIKRGRDLSHAQLALVTALAFGASGHDLLWGRLLECIRRNASATLVYPVVSGVLPALEKLRRELGGYSRTQQLQTLGELDEARAQLGAFEQRLQDRLGEEARALAAAQEGLLDFLAGEPDFADGEVYKRFIAFLRSGLLAREAEHGNLFKLPFIVQDLKKALNKHTLRKLRGFFKEEALTREVEGYFAARVPLELARELADAYERLGRLWRGPLIDEGFCIEVGADDPRLEQWRALQKNMADYFVAVRRVLTYETERYLRGWGKILGREVAALVRQQAEHVWSQLPREDGELLGGLGGELRGEPILLQLEELEIPQDVLSIADPTLTTSRTETLSEAKRVSCFQRTVTREVERVVVQIPSSGEVTDLLNAGINAEEHAFYQRIYGWFARSLDLAHEGLRDQLDDYFEVLRQGIAAREQALEQDAGAILERWGELDAELERFAQGCQTLTRAAGMSAGGAQERRTHGS